MSGTQIIAAVLITAGAVWLVGVFAYGKWKARPVRPAVTTSTKVPTAVASADAPAPPGIADYLKMIDDCCKTATADVKLGYARLGLSEADVLRSEVQRLGAAK